MGLLELAQEAFAKIKRGRSSLRDGDKRQQAEYEINELNEISPPPILSADDDHVLALVKELFPWTRLPRKSAIEIDPMTAPCQRFALKLESLPEIRPRPADARCPY